MRKATTLALSVMSALCLTAQEPDVRTIVDAINDGAGNVVIVQAQALDELISPKTNTTADTPNGTASRRGTGFRVEVYSDNNVREAKSTAEYRKRMIQERFGIPGYLTFNSPYWTLRVGDYHTYNDAQSALNEIKAAFPAYAHDLRVVRERINITE